MPKADSHSPKKTSRTDFGASKTFVKGLAERPFETKTTIAIWRDQPRLQMNTRTWLARSAINEHVSNFCSYLRCRRYAEHTIRLYVCCVAHFARWMKNQRVNLRTLDRSTIERFLSTHLPGCGCARPVRKGAHDHRAALRHLLKVLQENGAIAAKRQPLNSVDREVAAFHQYMEQTRGLARNTFTQRAQIVRRFLIDKFGQRPVVVAHLKTFDVRQFVLSRMSCWSPSSKQVIAGALRCYLRFRALSGDQVGALLAAIPKVANWRLAILPEVPAEKEVGLLLRSFDAFVPSAKRGYAMVRCLVDLGLRSSEVIHLQLDDIDWRNGVIRLAKGKCRRADILPLPLETGRAIVDYLVDERPKTANRNVFVRHKAPFDEPIKASVVGRVVRQAYKRCGSSRTRVHILRHSMASRLLRTGSPLKEIADILRHRCLDSSVIYTKVDVNRLSAVALPWPGSAS
jgi:integrase/recombinase XerD